MIVSPEYAALWGVKLAKDGAEVSFESLDTDKAKVEIVDADGVAVEHDLADFDTEGLERFLLFHGS